MDGRGLDCGLASNGGNEVDEEDNAGAIDEEEEEREGALNEDDGIMALDFEEKPCMASFSSNSQAKLAARKRDARSYAITSYLMCSFKPLRKQSIRAPSNKLYTVC